MKYFMERPHPVSQYVEWGSRHRVMGAISFVLAMYAVFMGLPILLVYIFSH